jgi:hypothetical protein
MLHAYMSMYKKQAQAQTKKSMLSNTARATQHAAAHLDGDHLGFHHLVRLLHRAGHEHRTHIVLHTHRKKKKMDMSALPLVHDHGSA